MSLSMDKVELIMTESPQEAMPLRTLLPATLMWEPVQRQSRVRMVLSKVAAVLTDILEPSCALPHTETPLPTVTDCFTVQQPDNVELANTLKPDPRHAEAVTEISLAQRALPTMLRLSLTRNAALTDTEPWTSMPAEHDAVSPNCDEPKTESADPTNSEP